MIKERFLNMTKKNKSPFIQKNLETDCVSSKRESSRIANRHGREPFIGDEFMFNVVQHKELFKDEFENFIDMSPSNSRRRPRRRKGKRCGRSCIEWRSVFILTIYEGKRSLASAMEKFLLVMQKEGDKSKGFAGI